MRGILKSVGVTALSLYFTQQLIPAVKFANISYFVILSGLIYLANYLIDPLAKILFFLPINFTVLVLVHVLVNFLVLFFASSSFEEFEISNFNFPGFENYGSNITPFDFSPIQTTIIAAVIITLISGFFNWLTE